MSDYFEYWMLPPGTDNEKTKIVRATKEGKYLVFYRDDGKECKYDLSNGDVIGFSGRKVKSLQSQMKDLTADHMIDLFDDENYRNFLEYSWSHRPRNRAWWFVEALPDCAKYEQFFSSGIKELEYTFKTPFEEVPKGLIKICRDYELPLTRALLSLYNENIDVFNLYYEINLQNISYALLNDAILYKNRKKKNPIKIDEEDLTIRTETIDVEHRPAPRGMKTFFFTLIEKYGYQPKLLMEYFDEEGIDDSVCQDDFYRELYDYANMMSSLYDNFDRYPSGFKNAHERVCCEFNNIDIKYDEQKYKSRNVLEYECEIDGFRFIYPKTTKEIKKEGKSQHNCVATYIPDVLSERCHIMFMRPINNLDESYITLEINNNEIVQAKRKYNKEPSDEEYEIINKWNERYRDFKLN